MNRRQLIKTALVALPSSVVLGRSAAPLAQEAPPALHAVLNEIVQTNAWTTDMARYYEIRWGALTGTYFVQLLNNTDSGSQRTTPAIMVGDLLPHDYDNWVHINGPMLSQFVKQELGKLATALNELYVRRGTDYNSMLAQLGIEADGAVATSVSSGAMVASLVSLAAAFHNNPVPGLDPNSIDQNNITDSLETVAMAVYPC